MKITRSQVVSSIVGLIAPFFIGGCETIGESDENQFVDPNTADVRGTWYDHGSDGGWYGPNNEWGFGWYYLKQYGSEIEGRYEFELYDQGTSFDGLTKVTGAINGNRVILTKHYTHDNSVFNEGFVAEENRMGRLERTSTGLERRKTPW